MSKHKIHNAFFKSATFEEKEIIQFYCAIRNAGVTMDITDLRILLSLLPELLNKTIPTSEPLTQHEMRTQILTHLLEGAYFQFDDPTSLRPPSTVSHGKRGANAS